MLNIVPTILLWQQLLDVSPTCCPQVQLCETRRELQELKASLRVGQKEKEQLLTEKQVSASAWSQHRLTNVLEMFKPSRLRMVDHFTNTFVTVCTTLKLCTFD